MSGTGTAAASRRGARYGTSFIAFPQAITPKWRSSP
jgi:hypothetical protein